MYEDMKKQMEHVEGDLARSKQLREKQAKEFQRQIDDERQRHEQKVTYNILLLIPCFESILIEL